MPFKIENITMIEIKRPFLFGANREMLKVFANDKLVCVLSPQSSTKINLPTGKHRFRVESKSFKSKETLINLKKGDKLIIGSPRVLWASPFLPAILLAAYYWLNFDIKFLIAGAIFALIIALSIYLPEYKNDFYSIAKE